MTDSGPEGNKHTWHPLESNPEAFNKYIQKLGVKGVECVELFGFDEELLNFVPGPHLALVFCYPYQEKANAYLKQLYADLAANKGKVPEWAFFMRQKISNACGTFALFHAITNNIPQIDIGDGPFSKWYKEAKPLGIQQRSDSLANNQEMAESHKVCAEEADTEVPAADKVEYHFICYVHKNGRLYEFDSGQDFPRDCGPSSETTLLIDAGKVCQQLMDRLDNISCNAIALIAKE